MCIELRPGMNYDRGVRFVGPADLVCWLMWVRDWGCERGSWQCVVGVRGICGVEAEFKGWVDDQLMVETVRSHRGCRSVVRTLQPCGRTSKGIGRRMHV